MSTGSMSNVQRTLVDLNAIGSCVKPPNFEQYTDSPTILQNIFSQRDIACTEGIFIPSIRTPTACLEGRQRDDFDFLDPFHNLLHLDLNLGLANLESRFNAEANEARALKQNA
ncbi:hypothetical protein SIIN_2115_T [Serendipita indica DSM 11827]|nr:hypothetical protein SIIN_2115_T [Serendipita indica DSM 11827]